MACMANIEATQRMIASKITKALPGSRVIAPNRASKLQVLETSDNLLLELVVRALQEEKALHGAGAVAPPLDCAMPIAAWPQPCSLSAK